MQILRDNQDLFSKFIEHQVGLNEAEKVSGLEAVADISTTSSLSRTRSPRLCLLWDSERFTFGKDGGLSKMTGVNADDSSPHLLMTVAEQSL